MEDLRRHVLVRVGAAPVTLKHGESFVLGRSPDTDLTIPSQRVSRRHSEIFWRRGRPWIRDLGSQNGTSVNGKRTSGDTELKDGDEITAGPFLCTYRAVAGRGRVAALPARPDTDALPQPMLGDTMAGNLEQMNLFELLQTLEFNQKTGTLEIFGSDGDGTMIIRDGRPVYALCGRDVGLEGALSMLQIQTGQFSFSPDISEASSNMQTTVTSLLLEAGRRMDESGG
jgi:hypothetical protein